jgi:hypothetical protein
MTTFTVIATALFGASVALAQKGLTTTTFPPASIPTLSPSDSSSDAIQLIGNIPPCWQPCVGGAIKVACPTEDSWECVCNAYLTATYVGLNFLELTGADSDCFGCPTNVGPSDGPLESMS